MGALKTDLLPTNQYMLSECFLHDLGKDTKMSNFDWKKGIKTTQIVI